jgi:Disulphide bond corrector protein DsbC
MITKAGPIDLANWLKLSAWTEPLDMKPGSEGKFFLKIGIPDMGHIQSHGTSDTFLVPAELILDAVDDVAFGQVQYPPPSEEKVFDWVWMKRVLRVYSGTIMLIVPFTLSSHAATGVRKVQARFRYQGCTVSDCLPPNSQTVEAEMRVRL